MELSDIILGLVGILTTIIGWVVRNVVTDIKELEHNMNVCQTALPEKYVMKSDYKDDMGYNNHFNPDYSGVVETQLLQDFKVEDFYNRLIK